VSASSPPMPAVFYDVDADRIAVEPAPAREPWDNGCVRLTHVLRDDNGNVGPHVLDLSPDDARELADALLCAAAAAAPDGVRPPGTPRQDAFRVWREADRIRNAAGVGYADFVDDEQIGRHVRAHLDEARYQDAAFCAAVLSLRQQERAS
jgi:Zn ribbon nucleic-acid-binding protein